MLDDTCGIVVEKDDIDSMEKAIRVVCEQKPFSVQSCTNKAKEYDMNDRFDEYIKLYKELI